MSEQEAPSPQQWASDAIINVRNEAIVQAANVYLFGRQVVLTGVGMTFLGVDAAQTFVRRAVDRGEVVEADAQKLTADLQQQAHDRVKAADQARVELTEKATAALFENANGVLKRLGVPEMKVVFPGATAQAQPEAATAADAETAPPA
jgi:polyhydroxyalkanoate synthesis regulator phasin